jgi:hypothetical protein
VILSRFWYLLLSVALAGAVFLLYLSTAVSNRTSRTDAARLLTSASNAVGFYLKDDARTRTAALIPLALDGDVRKGLSAAAKAETMDKLKAELRDKTRSALKKFRQKEWDKEGGVKFDVLWAIDVHGRVVANDNFERGTSSEHFEMGGYAVVADALHGWIRDDAWVFDGKIYRVVARPIEVEVGGTPVGAIVGAKVVDDSFAQAISDRTGAAVAFYDGTTRVASGAPQGFDKAFLEVNSADLQKVAEDKDYKEKGRTAARVIRENEAVADVTGIFARMPGEAWDLGAGYVVGHRQAQVQSPLEFQDLANDDDKKTVPLLLLYIILIAAGLTLLGLIFSVIEHTVPLRAFMRAVADLGNKKSSTDVLQPSTFRGLYKKIAAYVNDSLDKIAAQAGVDRGPADMERVLGPLPAQPQMSAFSVPKAGETSAPATPAAMPDEPKKPKRSLPKAPKKKAEDSELAERAKQVDEQMGAGDDFDEDAATRALDPSSLANPAAAAADANGAGELDEDSEWRGVYSEFVALKKQLGEPTERLTFEKFRGTLQRNKDALVQRHGCERVKFRVYEKAGKAALKASPVK